jgi:hypothetical protein
LPLFNWDKFPGNERYNLKVLKRLNDAFKLKWSLEADPKSGTCSLSNAIDFQKSHDDRVTTIEHGRTSKVRIELGQDNEKVMNASIILDGKIKRQKPLKTSIVGSNRYVALEVVAERYPIRYLDVVPKREPQDAEEELEFNENKRNWRYVLNVRGLIRYILGEITIEKKEKRKHSARISAMLRNLAANHLERFPFLLCYDVFREEYHRLEGTRKFPTLYEVEVLKRIAEELQYLVYAADLEYLKYYVTRRYSEEIMNYFIRSFQGGMIKNLGKLQYKTLKYYYTQTLRITTKYLKDELKRKEREYGRLFVY